MHDLKISCGIKGCGQRRGGIGGGGESMKGQYWGGAVNWGRQLNFGLFPTYNL